MKKLGLSLLCLTLSAHTLFADSSRVERFHHQKRHHHVMHHGPQQIHHIGRPTHLHRDSYGDRRGPHRVRYRYREPVYFFNRCDGGTLVMPRPYYHDRVRYVIGSRVDRLPYGARAVIIDDVRYFNYQNHYFLPQRRAGVRFYVVVDL